MQLLPTRSSRPSGLVPSRAPTSHTWSSVTCRLPHSHSVVTRADGGVRPQAGELSALHAELLQEIEERKRSQAALLAKLNRLSGGQLGAQAAVQAPVPGMPTRPPTPPSALPSPAMYQSMPTAQPMRSAPMPRPAPPPAQAAAPAAPSYTPQPPVPSYSRSPPSQQPAYTSQAYPQQSFPSSMPYPGSATGLPPGMVSSNTSTMPKPPSTVYDRGGYDSSVPAFTVEPDVPPALEVLPPPAVPEQPPLAGTNVMNIVMVGAECAPWSKTGGLGDVMGALPKALHRRGHRVMVVAPRYANYPDAWETGIRITISCLGANHEVGFFHCYKDGVDYVFVDHSCFNTRGADIYGGTPVDAMFRCSMLSKAAIEAVWHVPCGGVTYGDNNLCFVANDWHTALLPVYLQAHYRDWGKMTYARCVFIIHNIAHQGRAPFKEAETLELSEAYKEMFRLYDPVGGEHMNIMKVGLQTAHRIVAVSHGYAWECLTPEGGWGLHQILEDAKWKLKGIVNGIDYQEWSPQIDTFLLEDGYTQYDMKTLVQGKRQCKMALQRELGLPVDPDIPMLGFIGRLDYQKGVDLIRDSYDWLMGEKVQLVLLGSGRDDLECSLREMEERNKHQCRAWVGFSVKMAHRITAAADILLMPSRFEPCGLNQLYAMAYGTVPVVHAVGGLRDTVKPYNPFDDSGTGWAFDRADAERLRDAVGNALYTYRSFRDSFNRIALRGMEQDLSWDNAAQQYEDVLVAAKYQW